MSAPLGTLWALFGIGLILRLALAQVEARHLRWAWDWVVRKSEEDVNGARATILNRTHQALSAVRLARLLSLLLLIPSAVLLLDRYMGSGHTLTSLGALFAVAFVLYVFLTIATAMLMRGFYSEERPLTRKSSAKWLRDPSQRVPAPTAAGGLLWEWLVRQGQRVTPGPTKHRPRARLYEMDDELVMAVGESETEALDAATAEAPPWATDKTERDMVRSIQRLDTTLVREVMRPLNNVTAVPLMNLTAEKFLEIARRTGYTRFPCYFDQVTNLIGYLNVHDFIEKPTLPKDLRKLVHPALFIPEIARVDLALQEMLRQRLQIAICYDEFGGCSGLLSREDIIEEITGEIMDEYDRPETDKIQEVHGHYLVDGAIDLDDLQEMIGLSLEKKNCDTLAGYIYQRLSRTPRRGEGFVEGGWRIDVVQLDKHRIRRVRLSRIAEPQED